MKVSSAQLSKERWFDYMLVAMVLCLSGNTAFTHGSRQEPVLIIAALFCAIRIWQQKFPMFTPRTILPFLLFSGILFLQSIMLTFFPMNTMLGFLTRMFIGYATVRLVRNFPRVYVEVMFIVALLSLGFYIPDQCLLAAGIDIKPLFDPIRRVVGVSGSRTHILIYNFMAEEARIRNAGFFWEPGALAGYTLLAILFLALNNRHLEPMSYKIRILVLSICLLTTLSTTGYIALPLALLFHLKVAKSTTRIFTRAIFLALMFLLTLVLFAYRAQNLEFMTAKIRDQYNAVRDRRYGWETTRFGTIVFDWEYIKRRPIVGWGLHSETRFALHDDKTVGQQQGNGFTEFMAKFGILGMGAFSFLVWKGLFHMTGFHFFRSLSAILFILLILNTQSYLNYPLFLSLMFLGYQISYPVSYPDAAVHRPAVRKPARNLNP
jgi:hypothetical protein